MHAPRAHVILRDPHAPRPPAACLVGCTRSGVSVQLRGVPPRRRIGCELLLVLDRVVGAVSGAQIPVVGAVRVHRVEVEASAGTRVAEPDDIEHFANQSRPCPRGRIPAPVGNRRVVVRRRARFVRRH